MDLHQEKFDKYYAAAHAAVDSVVPIFLEFSEKDPEIFLKSGDFATEADYAIEKKLREELIRSTGIPVYGEEYGTWNPLEQPEPPRVAPMDPATGQHVELPKLDPRAGYSPQTVDFPDLFWVVDPIDGTANYAIGNQLCCIMVSLVYKRTPVVAVIDMPFLAQRYSAYRGSGLHRNGQKMSKLGGGVEQLIQIGFGSILAQRRGNIPITTRQDMLNQIGLSYPRMRVTGSVGVDLAFTAAGIFGGSLTFSPNIWDNSAGILLVEEAGGITSNLEGTPWLLGESGLIAGAPEVHPTLLHHIQEVAQQEGAQQEIAQSKKNTGE